MNEIRLGFSRNLKIRIGDQTFDGSLRIDTLKRTEDKLESWVCCWSSTHLSPPHAKTYGDDPLDALLNCVRFIASLIDAERVRGNAIWWRQEGDRAGLESLVAL